MLRRGLKSGKLPKALKNSIGVADSKLQSTASSLRGGQTHQLATPSIRASSLANVLVHSGGSGAYVEVTINYAPTLCRHAGKAPLCICYENHPNDSRIKESKDVSPQLTARCGTGGGNLPLIQEKTIKYNSVRQLTPIECERLMGFPDNYTQIPWKGKPAEKCPDSLRYKACGNSMCVNVMEWVGIRIDMVDKLLQK